MWMMTSPRIQSSRWMILQQQKKYDLLSELFLLFKPHFLVTAKGKQNMISEISVLIYFSQMAFLRQIKRTKITN